MKKLCFVLLLGLCALGLSGCLVVAAGAAVGIVGTSGDDSAYVVLDEDLDDTYDEALSVLKQKGKVEKEDRAGKTIVANIKDGDAVGSEVIATLSDVGDGKTKVTIAARKYGSNFTDQELAQHLCDLIAK